MKKHYLSKWAVRILRWAIICSRTLPFPMEQMSR